VGVDSRGCGTEGDADGAAEESEQDGFGEELGADVALGGAERAAQSDLGAAFQDGEVDGRGERGRFEDAGDVEPLAADPDAFVGVDAVDAEQLGGGSAEYDDGFSGGGSVEVVALGDRGGEDRQGGRAMRLGRSGRCCLSTGCRGVR
jgi:hypothetical protein